MIMGFIIVGSVYGASLGRSEMTGVFAFVGFTTACMLFGQILILMGIMEVTPANEVTENRSVSNYHQPAIDYRNYHYQSIIARINSNKITVTTVDEAIKTYSNLFNVGEKAARPFFQNQFVMTTLGLNMQSSSQVSEVSPSRQNESNKLNANFWDNVAEGVAKNEAKSDEICADPSCSKAVSAFDFRCFKCRGRFCADCETGKSIMCKSCS